MLATEDKTMKESLDYFDSNKYIEYVEILHDYPYRELNDDKELIDLINSYDLKYTIHSPFIDLNIASLNSALAKLSVEEIKRSIDLANMIDSDIVVAHPGFVSFNGRGKEDIIYEIGREGLVEIGDYAKDNGVNACIENLPKIEGFMYQDVNQLNDTLVELELPMTLDIGHAHTAGFSPDEIYFDSVKHIHVHDNPGDDDTHLALGDGTFDVNGFFDVFTKNGYDGIYMLELNHIDFIQKTLDYMKNLGLID
ncbi:sugar phosphate isomerase/epimerase family protein [Methanobrevibacter ruminantium]|nr:sugar phosphate isomerase/epimerase family protein [Methanobrevibacter ruminantium]